MCIELRRYISQGISISVVGESLIQGAALRKKSGKLLFLSVKLTFTIFFRDENCFEMVRFPVSTVPDDADFGVSVSGDSMERVYYDGQIMTGRLSG